jgi:carbonic anhydrase
MATRARDQVRKRWPDASKEFQQRACERAAIMVSLENLMTFNFVRSRVEKDQLFLFGWYFDIENGELMQYDAERRRFHDLYFD